MMIIEIGAGMIFGSMALLADGWHMGTHAMALGITAFTYRYARSHANDPRLYFRHGKSGDSGRIYQYSGAGSAYGRGILTAPDCRESLADSDGFFATGDLGYMDDAGQVYLQGRISSFIKRNGFRINPFEIEALLRTIPGVREAVVAGIPDLAAGEQMIACIETENGAEKPGIQDILKICRENLSPHKMPQRVVIMGNFPRTPAGKPDRPAIREYLNKDFSLRSK